MAVAAFAVDALAPQRGETRIREHRLLKVHPVNGRLPALQAARNGAVEPLHEKADASERPRGKQLYLGRVERGPRINGKGVD